MTEPRMFTRVLVANRGEIAVRVLATLRRLGIIGIAVASDSDRHAPHVKAADVAVHLDGPQPYLSVKDIVDAATRTGAQAIHPGYGFLSESPALAQACREAGITFIGPGVDAITLMGDKIAAKASVAAAGVPVVPGVHEPDMTDEQLVAAGDDVGYPLLVKAAAGGGGKGMRIVHDPQYLDAAIGAARREAMGAFGNDAMLLERLIARPRHIEIQVLADNHGTVWGFTERECSLQRRHQKVIEESPSRVLHADTRWRMIAAAVDAARACDYRGAGTVEFIIAGTDAVQPDAEFFFLEMNTRLQVEHPVTELIHDLDLVEWQVRIAAGEQLPEQAPQPVGHAVEARVYAENPARGFLPTGGTVIAYTEPDRPGVRVDSGVAAGTVVGSAYDPMLAKIIAFAPDRLLALDRLTAGLREFATLGVTTNNVFLQALLQHKDVRDGDLHTELIADQIDTLISMSDPVELRLLVPVVAAMARMGDGNANTGWRLLGRAAIVLRQSIADQDHLVTVRPFDAVDPFAATVTVDDAEPVVAVAFSPAAGTLAVTVDGIEMTWLVAETSAGVYVGLEGHQWFVSETAAIEAGAATGGGTGPMISPMPGTVAVIDVAQGDRVTAGQRLMVIEAMKMEHPILANIDGVVDRVWVRQGAQVAMDAPLADVVPEHLG